MSDCCYLYNVLVTPVIMTRTLFKLITMNYTTWNSFDESSNCRVYGHFPILSAEVLLTDKLH